MSYNDMQKIENHPGFMPFNTRNVKINTEDTQSEKDKADRAEEISNDNGLKENSNSERGE